MQGLFARCGFHGLDAYKAGLVVCMNASWRALALPLAAVAVTAWFAYDDTTIGLADWVHVAAIVWLVVIVALGTICVSVHRDRLTWHTLWRSRVVHWSRIDDMTVRRGRVEILVQGREPQHFKLVGVNSRRLLARLQTAAADGDIPRRVPIR